MEGGDQRKQGVTDVCKLCLKPSLLRLSHISPRWAGKWMKSEGMPISRVEALDVVVVMQDTSKHYLLCSGCEQWLGDAENYLAVLSRGTASEMRLKGIEIRPGPTLVGVNPKLVRRAVLGVLFKGHYAPSTPWANFGLSRKFISSLQRRLLADDYTDRSHPLFATKWMSCEAPEANARAITWPAWRDRPGLTAFDLMMAGWSWTVVFRGWSGMVRGGMISERFNLGTGPWDVLLGELTNSRAVQENSKLEWKGDKEQWWTWPRDRECPCGLGMLYGECCADTWCAEAARRARRG